MVCVPWDKDSLGHAVVFLHVRYQELYRGAWSYYWYGCRCLNLGLD